jgi:hypothetical protein
VVEKNIKMPYVPLRKKQTPKEGGCVFRNRQTTLEELKNDIGTNPVDNFITQMAI